MRATAATALALAALVTSGCDLVRDSAPSLLGRGRYPEALAKLEREEARAARYRGGERARYALYRGLAHFALGDAARTARWLGEAKALVDLEPGCLGDEDRGRLYDAWGSLGRGLLGLQRPKAPGAGDGALRWRGPN